MMEISQQLAHGVRKGTLNIYLHIILNMRTHISVSCVLDMIFSDFFFLLLMFHIYLSTGKVV